MKKFRVIKTLKQRKQGDIVLLDENSFWTVMLKCKGIIQPYTEEDVKKEIESSGIQVVKTAKDVKKAVRRLRKKKQEKK